MGFIKKLVNGFISKFITGDLFAGQIRTGLAYLAGILVASGWVSLENASGLSEAFYNIVTSPELAASFLALLTASGGSAVNKIKKKDS